MAPLRLLATLSLCLASASAFSNQPFVSSTARKASSLQAGISTYLNDGNYNSLIMGDKAVLVDACAKWCGPCKLIEPFLVQAAGKYADELEVVKLDVEAKDNGGVKVEFLMEGVMPEALPSLILFRGGKHIATHTGALTLDELDEFIMSNLLQPEAAKKEEREPELVGGGRGFVSFASRDDYAL
ncbi:Thioredoxin X, chloroplastic [Seminavis robusta]|uniref:Thioredoxin X, chloroplastic n=1 Tax=Seminavis robusta TaxID=568900 RepID=A0A9N8F5P5_9STRA|nr:Thioredoxin X, chloroplastic [Seminavis robusta]|eukprot:Sro3511_g348750.1 Thioredoxin X, chloroplastic (184) ;mRNA; f:3330-3881